MAQFFTSTTLINRIKLRAMIPEHQSTFTATDFLALANEEIAMGLVPMILRTHEDFFLVSEEVPLVANKTDYRIPSRAIGNKLKDITYKDSNGTIYEMTRIDIQDLPDYNKNLFSTNTVKTFYIKNNKVILASLGNISVTGSLVFSYYIRPNELVEDYRTATISAIYIPNTTEDPEQDDPIQITVTALPKDPVNDRELFRLYDNAGLPLNEYNQLDIIQKDSPHSLNGRDIIPVSIVGTVISISRDDFTSDIQVGDYINLAHECSVPQIPSDLHMQLAHRVALRCLEALGDMQGVQIAASKLAESNDLMHAVIDNRVESAPKKVVNRHSFLKKRY